MANLTYPLTQVLEIKIRRVEDAEKVVQEKQRLLKEEEEKLRQKEEERNKVKTHRMDKLNQLRDELDTGTTTDKIQQMKVYLKVVDERLKVEEQKVANQKEQVKIAEHNLEMAKEALRLKRIEVDKLETHREDWMREALIEQEKEEEKEMDEIGNVIYTLHMREKKQRQ